jgi:phospholipase/carboxylesterase
MPAKVDVSKATILVLHGHGGDLEQLKPLSSTVGRSLRVMLLEAKRPISPHAMNREMDEYGGYAWYLIQDVGYPEPASFGDSLRQVEQMIYDVLDREGFDGSPLFLLGYEQGAVLSLTAAVVLPEYVAGVVGICGYLPEIPGWSLPVEDMGAVSVLLVQDPQDQRIPPARVQKTVDELTRRGAMVGVKEVPGSWQEPLAAAEVLNEWLGVQFAKASAGVGSHL